MQLFTAKHKYTYRYYINISNYGNLILMCKKQIAEIRKARNILVSYTVIGYGSYSNSMVVANWLYTVSQKKTRNTNSCP